MKERDWVIGSGYGKLNETTIRIGHMGDRTVDELNLLLDDLEHVIR
jgi:aspartate aminotransferase-like enzyme